MPLTPETRKILALKAALRGAKVTIKRLRLEIAYNEALGKPKKGPGTFTERARARERANQIANSVITATPPPTTEDAYAVFHQSVQDAFNRGAVAPGPAVVTNTRPPGTYRAGAYQWVDAPPINWDGTPATPSHPTGGILGALRHDGLI